MNLSLDSISNVVYWKCLAVIRQVPSSDLECKAVSIDNDLEGQITKETATLKGLTGDPDTSTNTAR